MVSQNEALVGAPTRISREEERREGVAALHRVGPRKDDDDDDPGTGGGNDGTGGGETEADPGGREGRATKTTTDVATTGNEIVVKPAAEAVMDAIAAGAKHL